nr:MAG TPA: virion morphogenesis protein [Caudoviricetes sp.]
MAKNNRGIPLTPQQFRAQWELLPHTFDLNVWDFQVSVGQSAVDIFQKSFDMKRFNSRGSMVWKHNPKRNKGGFTVGGLVESRSLRNSIVYEAESYNRSRGKVKVFTDPKAFSGTYNHKGFCFAAVHNSDDSSVRTGRVANMPQRQFMPTEKRDSSVMNDKLRELERIFFRTFPGVRR